MRPVPKRLPAELPPTEFKAPQLTEQETKEMEELVRQEFELDKEALAFPSQKDWVKVLISGEVGQIVERYVAPDPNQPTGPRYFGNESELQKKRRCLESKRWNLALNKQYLRYEVRLKSGLIVRDLRCWELEKTAEFSR